MVSIDQPIVQSPAPTAVQTARRWTCSDSERVGKAAGASGSRSPGASVGTRGSMILGLGSKCALGHESPTRLTASGSEAACRLRSSRFNMIEWFERSSSAMTSSRGRAGRRTGPPFEERPQPLADRRRQHAFEVLERRPRRCSSSVCRLRNAICSGSRCSTSDSSVKTCARLSPARSRTNASSGDSLANPSSSRRLSHTGRPTATSRSTTSKIRSLSIWIRGFFSTMRGQRPRRLAADVEPQIVEAEHEAVRRALRHADREHARQAAADGELLVRIDQRVDQLADALLGDLAQREHRVIGDRIPRQQRNHVRHEAGRQPFCPRQHLHDRSRSRERSLRMSCMSGSSRDAGRSGVDADCAGVPHVGVPDAAHQRPVRAVFRRTDRPRRRG